MPVFRLKKHYRKLTVRDERKKNRWEYPLGVRGDLNLREYHNVPKIYLFIYKRRIC